MKILGTFKNIHNQLIKMIIYKNDNTSDVINIDTADWIHFADNPIEISYEAGDLFETLINKSCTISLFTKHYLGDYLYADNQHDVLINIFNETKDRCIFAGYVEPNIYSQGYSNNYDKIEIQCTDILSSLQYDNIYDTLFSKQNSLQMTFSDYLKYIGLITSDIDLKYHRTNHIWYDNSKVQPSTQNKHIFDVLSVPLNVFLDETPSDSDTNDIVLSELLKYLNLHIIQVGFDLYIFDWESLKNDKFDWICIDQPGLINYAGFINLKNVTKEDYSSSDTSISLDDTYNQIQVKCELINGDNFIQSPLDKDNIYSDYKSSQFYGWEYTSNDTATWFPAYFLYDSFQPIMDPKGNVSDNRRIFRSPSQILNLLKHYEFGSNPKDRNWLYMWYFRLLKSRNWKFNGTRKMTFESDYKLVDMYQMEDERHKDKDNRQWQGWLTRQVVNSANMHDDPNKTRFKISPFICQFGKSDNYFGVKSDDLNNKITWNNYIVIPVNGNGLDKPTTTNVGYEEPYPSESDLNPETGNFSSIEYIDYQNVSLSPNDDDTTNYIVFSGKIFMQQIWDANDHFDKITYAKELHDKNPLGINMTPKIFIANASQKMIDGSSKAWSSCMYDFKISNKWSNADMSGSTGEYGTPFYLRKADDSFSIYPPSETPYNDNSYLYYDGNDDHSTYDRIENVPILECQMKIGDKYLVYYDDKFGWYDENSLPEITDDEGIVYKKNTFTLGINPTIGDQLLGKEWDILNSVTPDMRLNDAEGTVIPIKKSDHVQGVLSFKILGPVNTSWMNHSYRHRTWFRRGKWTNTSKLVLPHVKTIFIKDFECKVYSDYGGHESLEEKDLIYISDEVDKYINKKDDISFKINTALTSSEAYNYGLKNVINISNVINNEQHEMLREIHDQNIDITAKPEELYINQYFNSYCQPKLIVETELHDIDSRFTLSKFMLGQYYKNKDKSEKQFIPLGMTEYVGNCVTQIKLREI